MDGLRHYIIAVTAAAILCGMVKSISEKVASGKIIKLICELIHNHFVFEVEHYYTKLKLSYPHLG